MAFPVPSDQMQRLPSASRSRETEKPRVRRLCLGVAFLFGEHGLWGRQASVVMAHGLALPQGMWALPGPGIEPTSLTLAGRFFTTGPPEKSQIAHFLNTLFH